jgi:hypothetical protein
MAIYLRDQMLREQVIAKILICLVDQLILLPILIQLLEIVNPNKKSTVYLGGHVRKSIFSLMRKSTFFRKHL